MTWTRCSELFKAQIADFKTLSLRPKGRSLGPCMSRARRDPSVSNLSPDHSFLEDLYQEVIVDHSQRPRYRGKPAGGCQVCQEGKNPLCGDSLRLYCQVGDNQKVSLSFEGQGCRISMASASILCSSLQGATVGEARQAIARAEAIYSGTCSPKDTEELADDVEALFGVSRFPVRIKCAALAWKTLELLLGEHFSSRGAEPRLPKGRETGARRKPPRTLRVANLDEVTTQPKADA